MVSKRKLLFVTTHPFFPEASGGAELSTVYLFDRLCKQGWHVEVICGSSDSGWSRSASLLELKRLRKTSIFWIDQSSGYSCWRGVVRHDRIQEWIQFLDRRLDEFRPDMVMGYPNPMCPLLNHAAREGYPSFYYAHDLAVKECGYQIPPEIHVLANAPYTAEHLSPMTEQGVGIVLEMIDPKLYRVPARKANQHERLHITFINPIPKKGISVAIQVVKLLPDKKFLFVKGGWWGIDRRAEESWLKPVLDLPNVEIWENQKDMRNVYRVTKILLVPSQFDETFGRVIIEGQLNGIPVVAANSGGIPYALGAGGVLVESKDDSRAYARAIRRLYGDQRFYGRLASAALENIRRPEFNPRQQVQNFIRFVESRLRHSC